MKQMQMKRHAVLGAICGLVLMAGCRGGRGPSRPELDAMIPLVTAQIGETLLGPATRSLTSTPEPPLLGGSRTRVVLAADEAAFVQVVGQGIRPQDVRSVVDRIGRELNNELRRRRLSCTVTSFPATCDEREKASTVLATLTPTTLETGGPQDRAEGKNQTLLMARLVLTAASDGHELARREFFSGYTLPKPRAGR